VDSEPSSRIEISEPKVYLFLGYGPITSRIIDQVLKLENSIIHLITQRPINATFSPSINVCRPAQATDLVRTVSFDFVLNAWRSLHSTRHLNQEHFLAELGSLNRDIQFINLSTVAVYGDSDVVHKEVSNTNPINDYGREKLEIERYLEGCGMFKVQNLRIANVFGDRDFKDVINKIIQANLTKTKISLTDPHGVCRDFIHVDTIVDFVLRLSNCLPSVDFETVNVGTGKSTYLFEVVEIFEEILLSKLNYEIVSNRTDEVQISRIDTEKFQSIFEINKAPLSEQFRIYSSQWTG